MSEGDALVTKGQRAIAEMFEVGPKFAGLITSKTGTTPTRAMTQVAPYPGVLVDLVRNRVRLREPGWKMLIEEMDRGQGSEGLTLTILALVPDSRDPDGGAVRIAHLFPVPPASYNERSWRHWLFECYCDVVRHEAAEMFEVDGRLPFAPLHAPGNDPYMVVEATRTEEHTDNQGRVNTSYSPQVLDADRSGAVL